MKKKEQKGGLFSDRKLMVNIKIGLIIRHNFKALMLSNF